ncbi:MAG: EF-hand domain-containing protein [Methylobacterium sp.]|uniref:EF-hand domain-containing protein n=1 Tax=Methylobacterium sp. TaxID=409 RepID=UPI0025E86DCF|nr:EF-hand domain-containing protein [Methylobacterium sp.]MBX9930026.1 EF-hand domain-containing protein [Methylobacterium sp.]
MVFRISTAVAALVLTAPITVLPAAAKPAGPSKVIAMVDTDNDGTIDLKEVTAVASAAFDKLEKDADGTLDAKELKGRISKASLKAADPDSDGTLDKKEYLAVVESLFKAADPDNDGTLEAKELKSKAGKSLTALLK